MIFYLSGTGNSRWIANKLSIATHDSLVAIADYMRNDLPAYDMSTPFELQPDERLGFVFPVHGWRVPILVRRFLRQMTVRSSSSRRPFTYAVCTAGDNIGLTMDYLNQCLRANESLLKLGVTEADSLYSLIMPESYVGLPLMDVDSPKTEKKKVSEAAERMEAITREIVAKEHGKKILDKGHFPWINSKIIGGFFEKVLITDKRFHVEASRCSKCGKCAKACPVGNIKGGKGIFPEWLHHTDCLTCFACYHHCPHHAIEFGRQTQKKGQYFFGKEK